MILVSACLVGINCKYSGGNNFNQKIFDLVKEGKAIPICPEQLGGLKTPRKPVELKVIDGKRYAIDNEGNDVTENFERGAIEVLKLAKSLNINKAILQPRSPSCGVNFVYDGSFNGNKVKGKGITAEMLNEIGIKTLSEKDLEVQGLNV